MSDGLSGEPSPGDAVTPRPESYARYVDRLKRAYAEARARGDKPGQAAVLHDLSATIAAMLETRG
jgi:hypothetical protein